MHPDAAPQIAVEVILMIASRGFRILGSGTCPIRTSFLPYQHSAFINPFPSRLAARLPVSGGDLTGLHQALEATQIVLDLNRGLLTEQLRGPRADHAARQIVEDRDLDLRAAPARSRLEIEIG